MIKISIVLLAGFAAIPWLRRRSAAERHVLWSAILAAAALMPLFDLLTPAWSP